MTPALTTSARDRLRDQARLERDLAARVIAAQHRLTLSTERRDALIAAQDKVVARCRDAVADALTGYLNLAGVGIERAALVLDCPTKELRTLVRRRRSKRPGEESPRTA